MPGLLRDAIVWALGIAMWLTFIENVRSHDHWISRAQFKNAAGEWCCGKDDCPVIDPAHVLRDKGDVILLRPDANIPGLLRTWEVVPEREVMPSPDGTYVRCHNRDGSRRCFFAPRPTS